MNHLLNYGIHLVNFWCTGVKIATPRGEIYSIGVCSAPRFLVASFATVVSLLITIEFLFTLYYINLKLQPQGERNIFKLNNYIIGT